MLQKVDHEKSLMALTLGFLSLTFFYIVKRKITKGSSARVHHICTYTVPRFPLNMFDHSEFLPFYGILSPQVCSTSHTSALNT